MKKNICVIFGGVSAERDVSIITGLQVIEHIDRQSFNPYAIEISSDGFFYWYKKLISRKNFKLSRASCVTFGRDKKGAYIITTGILKEKIYIDCVYLATHGGNGESGQLQGFLDVLCLPYTSPSVESSAITMNKALTKEVLQSHNIPVVSWMRIFSREVTADIEDSLKQIAKYLTLPLIIKPVHLGSSIGISIAKTKIELKKSLLAASQIDTEILVEKLLTGFYEYNLSVKKVDKEIIVSEVEKPISHDEILSFADKYESGAKKTGGMASLGRDLPAKITTNMKANLQKTAVEVYSIIRAKGIVRIDFMVVGTKIYVTEVNSIPGSISYYLWEASGISFKDQITELISQTLIEKEKQSSRITYSTDIVERFTRQ